MHLGQIRFDRYLTPPGAIGQPIGITFSDGSEASYGAILYLRWETEDVVGLEVSLSRRPSDSPLSDPANKGDTSTKN